MPRTSSGECCWMAPFSAQSSAGHGAAASRIVALRRSCVHHFAFIFAF